MKEKITLLSKQIRFKRNGIHFLKKSVIHSFRLNQANPNYIPEKSYLNQYWLNGEKSSPENIGQHFDSFTIPCGIGEKDSNRRSKLKSKFKRWIDNTKTCNEEIRLYEQIIKRLDNDKPIKNALGHFLKIEGKLSRYNDKKRAIEELETLQSSLIKKNSSSGGFEVVCIERLFKIPDHNGFRLTGNEQMEILEGYISKHFPDYPIVASAIHRDEDSNGIGLAHYHGFQTGINRITGEANYPDAELEFLSQLHPDKIFLKKKWSKLSKTQCRIAGELSQKHFYEYCNQWLADRDYNWRFAITQPTPERQEVRQKIKEQAALPIAEREYNLQNKLKEANTVLKAALHHALLYITKIAEGLQKAAKVERKKALDLFVKATIRAGDDELVQDTHDQLEKLDQPLKKLNAPLLAPAFRKAIKEKRKDIYGR